MNLEFPEDNGDFLVIPITDVDIKGHLINNYSIEPKHVDIRDIIHRNKFKACLLASKHEVLICRPSVSYPFLNGSEKVYAKQAGLGVLCERSKQGCEFVKNAILSDEEHQIKRSLFRFAEEYDLTIEYTLLKSARKVWGDPIQNHSNSI